MKFGGSSVGRPESLARVVEIIRRERRTGPLAVVVSAMGDTTDHLLAAVAHAAAGERVEAEMMVDRIVDLAAGLATEVGGLPDARLYVAALTEPLRELLHGVSLVRERTPQTVDHVLSFGERLSASIIARIVGADGPAVFVDARRWVVTDDRFGEALVDWEASRASLHALLPAWDDAVPIVTGFLGQTPDGRTTTLGRNGSDYTATLLARGLEAAEVNVWTDVSGVMTADPALVAEAYPLSHLSYMEALELANFGARMFHPRTMIPLIESGVPMRIRSTMNTDGPQTRVDAKGAEDTARPTSVTTLEDLALLGLQWQRITHSANLGERVMRALERAGVPVWLFTQAAHGQAMAFVVRRTSADVARAAVNAELAAELERGDLVPMRARAPVTLLTLVAETMGQTANVAGRLFHALGGVGVNVRAIAQGASARSVSCVIDAPDTAQAARTVHAAFNLAHQEVNVLVLGTGTVGGRLLTQIRGQAEILERDHDVRLRIVGVVDSRGWVFGADGVDPDARPAPDASWRWPLDAEHPLLGLLDRLRRMPVPVLVDCTAADDMERAYHAAFERGIHVVTANKKPLTGPGETYRALLRAARQSARAFRYETTCGAALPVVGTVSSLLRTGDAMRRIEGSLSGTLGFLANELMAGVPLSAAVRFAREAGYTEPHPREDLSGTDVARKALILARELELELSDIEIEPFVPAEILETADLDAFFGALEARDAEIGAWVGALREKGQLLRYLAVIDPAAKPAIRVGPVPVPLEHPSARLRGADAFVSLTTARYAGHPLLVQGAGAGGEVTASGVLTDVLQVAQAVRG